MEIVGAVLLFVIGLIVLFFGIASVVVAIQKMDEKDTSGGAGLGMILLVIGIALWYATGNWFFDTYDVVRTQ